MIADSNIFHVKSLKHIKSKTPIPNQVCIFSKNLSISSEISTKSTPLHNHIPGSRSYGIAVLQGTSSHLFKVRNLSASGIILMCMNPDLVASKFVNLVLVNGRGGFHATNLPDLSDLALLPKGLKLYYECLLKSSSADNIASNLAVIEAMCSVAVPCYHEIFPLDEGVHEIDIKSFSNVMKTVRFNQNMVEAVMVQLETKSNTTDWRDGRTTTVTMELRGSAVLPRRDRCVRKRQRNDSVRNMVIWNCRGMGKYGFRSVYDYILEFMDPDVLILTETRVSGLIGKALLQKNGPESVKFHDPVGITAGVAVITLSQDVKARMYNSGPVSNVELVLC